MIFSRIQLSLVVKEGKKLPYEEGAFPMPLHLAPFFAVHVHIGFSCNDILKGLEQ